MKHINIVIIDGVERDMATLSAEEREKIVNELNRVAVGYLGYQKEKTASAVGEVDKHAVKTGNTTGGEAAD